MALARTAAIVAGLVLQAVTAAAGPGDAIPPCGACAAIAIEPADAASLPATLNGLVVLVRVDRSAVASDALSLIRDRGGRPGLIVVDPGDEPAADVARLTEIVLLDTRLIFGAAPEAAFVLKTWLTRWRSHLARGSELGVVVSASVVPQLLEQGLAPYLDFIAGPPGPDPIPRWHIGGELTDAANAAQAGTRTTLWAAPRDEAVRVAVLNELALSRTRCHAT